MRPDQRHDEQAAMHQAGLWLGSRHTICVICDRYVVTDEERVCLPCAHRLLVLDETEGFVAGFEMGEVPVP